MSAHSSILDRKFHRQRILVGYSLCGHKELKNITEHTNSVKGFYRSLQLFVFSSLQLCLNAVLHFS